MPSSFYRPDPADTRATLREVRRHSRAETAERERLKRAQVPPKKDDDLNEIARLRAKAEASRERAESILSRAQDEAQRIVARAQAEHDELTKDADTFDRAANLIEERMGQGPKGRYQRAELSPRDQEATVNKVTPAEHSLETSKGRAHGNPLVEAANRRGLTLRSLAEVVSVRVGRKVAHSHLSMMYRGVRPLSDDVRQAVREAIGFDSWIRR